LRTEYGFQKLSVCEMLHCTFSELPERCKKPADYALAIAYMVEKDARFREIQAKAKAKAEAEVRMRKAGKG